MIKLAGKIETYKALADQISNSKNGGLVAYMARKISTNPQADILNLNGTYEETTKIADMLQRSYTNKRFGSRQRV